jgi:hypothetical protein
MQSPNYIQIISQLKLVVNELQNHLGKPKINFVSLSIISSFFFFFRSMCGVLYLGSTFFLPRIHIYLLTTRITSSFFQIFYMVEL